jgi:hypothetical protein
MLQEQRADGRDQWPIIAGNGDGAPAERQGLVPRPEVAG